MAGTWRVRIEALEGLSHRLAVVSSQSGDRPDDATSRTMVVLELSDGQTLQRTKPLEVPEDGNLRINKVLFVPVPDAGKQLVIRAIRLTRDSEAVVGEATLPKVFGSCKVDLLRREKVRGAIRLSVSEGLSIPPAGVAPDALPTPPQWNEKPQLPNMRENPRQAMPTSPRAKSPPSDLVQPTLTMGSQQAMGSQPTLTMGSGSRKLPGPPPISTKDPGTEHVQQSPSPSSGAGRVPRQPPASMSPPRSADPGTQDGRGKPSGRPVQAVKANVRALRMRHPALPFIGNCDVVVEGGNFSPALQQPILIIGLEGQEFLAEDTSKPLKYMFQFGAVQSNLIIYCYDAVQTQNSPLGRILVPLSDTLWPSGEAPSLGRIMAGFKKDLRTFTQQYTLEFMPASEYGDSHNDPSFVESFGPGLIEARHKGPDQKASLGQISLTIEVTFRSEVTTLMGFYLQSILMGIKGPGPFLGDPNMGKKADSQEEVSVMSVLGNPELRRVLTNLSRLKHFCNQPSGFVRFLREKPYHGYIAAGAWFFFCVMGFFPCSLWVFPIYAWLALLGNGFLAATQRETDWKCEGGKVKNPFWYEPADTGRVGNDANMRVRTAMVKFKQQLQEVEPWIQTVVVFLERVSNTFVFADGPASIVCFLSVGASLATMSLSILIFSYLDGVNFIIGLYGALCLVMLARPPDQQPLPQYSSQQGGQGEQQSVTRALIQALQFVPDQAELAHRFVATRIQSCEPLEV